MFALNLLLATVFVVASARHLPWDHQRYDQGYFLGFDEKERPIYDQRDLLQEPEESYHPGNLARTRRDSSIVPVGNNDTAAQGFKLQLENNGEQSLAMMKQNVTGLENSWTGSGKLNVFHNDDHNVDLRASLTSHIPARPSAPNYNTFGGGVDYMYKDKVGASLGMSNTPSRDIMGYSAMGNLNLQKSDHFFGFHWWRQKDEYSRLGERLSSFCF